MEDTYIAHFIKEKDNTIITQSVSQHNSNVASLAMSNSPLHELSYIAWLCGILHDAGKYREGFLNYITRAMHDEAIRKGEEDHSSEGGFIMEQMMPGTHLSSVIQMAVYCHHGLYDSISLDKGTVFIESRLNKKENRENADQMYFQFTDRQLLEKNCLQSKMELGNIMKRILCFIKSENKSRNQFGNPEFYLGMYERVILSLLIDADRTDTACFMQQKPLPVPGTIEETDKIWDKSIENLEEFLQNMKTKSRLDPYRRAISQMCMDAGKTAKRRYRLTVPTGAGKTLSSLRFALYHAREYHKKHIIYVAPYQSIIDQNAEEIRKAVGDETIVLEHHSNIICEGEEAQRRYEILTDNWDSPIIVTTAVQFLNTLFAGGNGNIRRMYNILNSVIIFDEVQALPVQVTKLFNLAVNFLTEFGQSTVVLCSATQPLFDELNENALLPPDNMIGETGFKDAFKRTQIIDATGDGLGLDSRGLSIDALQEFVWQKIEKMNQILVVVNTKKCAEKTYQRLKKVCEEGDCLLYHLSTNMCAVNRQHVLREMTGNLQAGKRLICVSTQLIEAGVDISFQCVVRSLAGLDSVIQAAGRCNRQGAQSMGEVYIVKLSKEAENTERIEAIQIAQKCMEIVLQQFKVYPDKFEHNLASENAIRLYYQLYLSERKADMEFPGNVHGVDITLLDLLSGNKKIWNGMPKEVKEYKKNLLFKQAFKTAGDLFEVITEDGKLDVVVEYDQEALKQLDILKSQYGTVQERKSALRRLQPYTVGISEQMCKKLGRAVYTICDKTILVLSSNYYSKETGVSEEPSGMEFMNF